MSLEDLVEPVRFGRNIMSELEKIKPQLKATLMKEVLGYQTQDGRTIDQIAKEKGLNVRQYVDELAEKRFSNFYKIEKLFEKLENFLANADFDNPLVEITINSLGRPVLAPVYAVVHATYKALSGILRGWVGMDLYEQNIKGGLYQAIDTIVMDLQGAADILGIRDIVDRLNLPSIEDKIFQATIRDTLDWIENDGQAKKGYMDKVIDYVGNKITPKEKEPGTYNERQSYFGDIMALNSYPLR